MTATLTMDAEHRYRIGDVEIPSVTQVIGSVLPGWQADEWYMQRGSAMHHGCRLMDEGRLDWSSVAPEIEGRLRAWKAFRDSFAAEVLVSERPVHHKIFRFAGTLDRIFVDAHGHLIIADIKSTICPQVEVQLGAYKRAFDDSGADLRAIGRGVAVELSDNGTYRTQWFTNKELTYSGQIFLACLSIYGFKRKAGIK